MRSFHFQLFSSYAQTICGAMLLYNALKDTCDHTIFYLLLLPFLYFVMHFTSKYLLVSNKHLELQEINAIESCFFLIYYNDLYTIVCMSSRRMKNKMKKKEISFSLYDYIPFKLYLGVYYVQNFRRFLCLGLSKKFLSSRCQIYYSNTQSYLHKLRTLKNHAQYFQTVFYLARIRCYYVHLYGSFVALNYAQTRMT